MHLSFQPQTILVAAHSKKQRNFYREQTHLLICFGISKSIVYQMPLREWEKDILKPPLISESAYNFSFKKNKSFLI